MSNFRSKIRKRSVIQGVPTKKNSTFLCFKTANESDLSNRQLRNHYSAKADSVNSGKQKDGHINPQSLLTRQEMETYFKKTVWVVVLIQKSHQHDSGLYFLLILHLWFS